MINSSAIKTDKQPPSPQSAPNRPIDNVHVIRVRIPLQLTCLVSVDIDSDILANLNGQEIESIAVADLTDPNNKLIAQAAAKAAATSNIVQSAVVALTQIGTELILQDKRIVFFTPFAGLIEDQKL